MAKLSLDIARSALAFLMGVMVTFGCNATQTTRCDDPAGADCPTSPNFGGGATAAEVKVISLKPLVAKPGQEVAVNGFNLTSGVDLQLGEIIVPWSSAMGSSAKFIMPATPRPGAFLLKVLRSGVSVGVVDDAARFMIADSAGDAVPIYMATPDKICSPEIFRDADGDLQQGTKTCAPVGLNSCTEDGAGGCVVDGVTYKAAAVANLSAGNIRSGVTIAGVNGQFPSSTYTLPGSSGVDLISSSFATQIKSSASFQYFDSTGVRYTGSGDANITASNIANGVSIFGTAGTYDGGAGSLNPWDLRIGVTVGAVSGKLKVNCRNRINSSIYNYDGASSGISNLGRLGGVAFDHWDTIDDLNGLAPGLPPSMVSGWSYNDCGGVESTPDDDHIWKDITTASGGTPSNCTTDGARCTMKDKISGLSWTRLQGGAHTWEQAIAGCDVVIHNSQSDWRLPTQKELMDAYSHGIRSAASTFWITEAAMNNFFWSASTYSYEETGSAWALAVGNGDLETGSKDNTFSFVCVR